MAVTGETVFTMAIRLIDAVESTGAINESAVAAYRALAPSILTLLQGELLPASAAVGQFTDLADNLAVTDRQALHVLPYGLASEMMISQDDDQTIANYFSRRYSEVKKRFPSVATSTTITDSYDITYDPSGGDF